MNTDAKLHPSMRGHSDIPDPDYALDLDGAASCVEGARKLGKEVVSRRIDHSASMLADEVRDLFAVNLKSPHCRDLVVGQEAAVADRVRAEDGGQSVYEDVGVHREIL